MSKYNKNELYKFLSMYTIHILKYPSWEEEKKQKICSRILGSAAYLDLNWISSKSISSGDRVIDSGSSPAWKLEITRIFEGIHN